jgi:hypothetical protein
VAPSFGIDFPPPHPGDAPPGYQSTPPRPLPRHPPAEMPQRDVVRSILRSTDRRVALVALRKWYCAKLLLTPDSPPCSKSCNSQPLLLAPLWAPTRNLFPARVTGLADWSLAKGRPRFHRGQISR